MSSTSQFVKDQPDGFINKIQSVAVIGATGQMGGHSVSELLNNPQFKVTVLTRKGGKSLNEMPKGIHSIKEVDYDNHDSIVEALKGQDVLIVTLATNVPQELPNKLVDAALEAKIKWYIPNDWAYDLDHNIKAQKETLHGIFKKYHSDYTTSKKDLPWTTISCGFWYEWSISGGLNMFGIDSNQRKARFYENGQIPLSTSTWIQSARALVAFLSLPILPKDENDKTLTMNNWRNGYVHVNSFHLNQRQMLNEVQKVTGTSDKDWEIEQVDVEKFWKENFDRFNNNDVTAFAPALYSRTFFADRPGDALDACQKDMKLLRLQANESLEEATKTAVEMQKADYIQNFFAKRAASSS